MKKIYAFCSGQSEFGIYGIAIVDQDGDLVEVAGHCSSSLSFLQGDLGFCDYGHGPWRKKKYAEMFPEGFEVVWVDEPMNHPVVGRMWSNV